MKLTEKQQLLIQEYLSDNLSDAHQIEFSEQVKDPNFRRSLWVQANVLDGLAQDHMDKIRKQIEGFSKEVISTTTKREKSKFGWLKYLVLVIAMIGALILFKTMTSTDQEEGQVLFAKHYQPYPAEDIARGREDQTIQLQNIMDAYAKADYKLTLAEINKSSSIEEVKIYKLIALIELERYQEANVVINELKKIVSSSTQDVAEWYEVLLLVKQNKLTDATKLAQAYVVKGNHLFNKELEGLLIDLNK